MMFKTRSTSRIHQGIQRGALALGVVVFWLPRRPRRQWPSRPPATPRPRSPSPGTSLPSFRKTVRSAIGPAPSVPCRCGPTRKCAPGSDRSREGRGARDAAVPLRQDRHSTPQGRPALERGRHPDDCALGRQRIASWQCRRSAGARVVSGRHQVGVHGRVRPARHHGSDQALHASGAGTGSLVAADCADRVDGRPLHQGDGRQAVGERPPGGAPRQQRSDGPR